MDELELLKKDWQSKEHKYPTVSTNDIYKMIHSKSSSIVKWIFIISLIELGLGLLAALLNPTFDLEVPMPRWTNIFTFALFPVIFYFIYKFYVNFKNISTTDNVKKLISNIIKTRRTVKHYVWFNVAYGAVFFATTFYIGLMNLGRDIEGSLISASSKDHLVLIGTVILATALFVGLALGIYYLLYGLLIKRLNKNYSELKKLEI